MPAASTVWGRAQALRGVARIAGALCAATAALAVSASAALAQEDGLDSGDTAWMLTSTALVLMMTVPGPRDVLRRHGAQEERAGDEHAGVRDLLPRDRWSGR